MTYAQLATKLGLHAEELKSLLASHGSFNDINEEVSEEVAEMLK